MDCVDTNLNPKLWSVSNMRAQDKSKQTGCQVADISFEAWSHLVVDEAGDLCRELPYACVEKLIREASALFALPWHLSISCSVHSQNIGQHADYAGQFARSMDWKSISRYVDFGPMTHRLTTCP
jgi:hypothetical protein